MGGGGLVEGNDVPRVRFRFCRNDVRVIDMDGWMRVEGSFLVYFPHPYSYMYMIIKYVCYLKNVADFIDSSCTVSAFMKLPGVATNKPTSSLITLITHSQVLKNFMCEDHRKPLI